MYAPEGYTRPPPARSTSTLALAWKRFMMAGPGVVLAEAPGASDEDAMGVTVAVAVPVVVCVALLGDAATLAVRKGEPGTGANTTPRRNSPVLAVYSLVALLPPRVVTRHTPVREHA